MTRHSGIGMTSERTRTRMIERLREQGIRDEVVLAAMQSVPRHIFVDEALSLRAYEDIALPIGFGQTISQPFVVARMCELMRNGRTLGRVLEVGAGCGYQSAVLSRLAREVIAVERLLSFVGRARQHLRESRAANVRLKHGDGTQGFPGGAPYDGIVVAAAGGVVPEPLKQQLAVGGRLVAPVGGREQRLLVIDRTDDGFREREHEPVKFVPLVAGLA